MVLETINDLLFEASNDGITDLSTFSDTLSSKEEVLIGNCLLKFSCQVKVDQHQPDSEEKSCHDVLITHQYSLLEDGMK